MHTRRNIMRLGLFGAGGALLLPGMALAAANTEKRFIFIIQRGAADGLATVMPVGDPDYSRHRSALMDTGAAPIRLDDMFALHPALPQIAKLYGKGQALFGHALASSYRERSHFDAQNMLESGGGRPFAIKDGWLNRLVGLLPPRKAGALAIAASPPLALRGPQPVTSYSPSRARDLPDDGLIDRVARLYEQDAQLRDLWSKAVMTQKLAGDAASSRKDAATTGQAAGRLLSAENGARVAMIETTGWDTHQGQKNRLGRELRRLDTLVAALQAELGPHWRDTVVLVATEFGRTVAVNGTQGTDHGTASAAMLLGGAVSGGMVQADWPGLSADALYQGRDLQPTGDLNRFIARAAAHHFALDEAVTMSTLFPASSA